MNKSQGSYFSRSWAMMTRNKGWAKPICVLAIGLLVPVVGSLAVLGYGLEWARLSAWGVDASPKQRGVRVGECIASGWRGFIVLLVWALIWCVVAGLFTLLMQALFRSTGEDIASGVIAAASYFVGVLAHMAAVHAAVYAKIAAGLSPSRLAEMLRRDPKGLLGIAGIPLVASIIMVALFVGLAAVLLALCFESITQLAQLIYIAQNGVQMMGGTVSIDVTGQLFSVVGQLLAVALPVITIFAYVLSVVSVAAMLLEVNAVGLWMAQFDVASWGNHTEPLPGRNGLPGISGA